MAGRKKATRTRKAVDDDARLWTGAVLKRVLEELEVPWADFEAAYQRAGRRATAGPSDARIKAVRKFQKTKDFDQLRKDLATALGKTGMVAKSTADAAVTEVIMAEG